MKNKKLGKTSIEASKIILGAGSVGGLVFKNGLDKGLEAVKEALDRGINWVDTAPLYGKGKSEEYLGIILKQLSKKPIVSTKVYIPKDKLDNIECVIMKSLENSLKTLNLDKVDVFILHNRVDDAGFRPDSISRDSLFKKDGLIDIFQKIKDKNMASNIGFTAFGNVDTLKDMIKDGRFDMFQSYVNLLNPSALYRAPKGYDQVDYKQMIKLANDEGVGVVAIRVLAAGVLAGVKNITNISPIAQGLGMPLEYNRLTRIKEVLQIDDKQVYKLALKFIFDNDEIGITALGFADVSHMYKALEVFEEKEDKKLLGQFKNAYESQKLL